MYPTLKPEDPFNFSYHMGVFFMEDFIYSANEMLFFLLLNQKEQQKSGRSPFTVS